MDNYVRYAIRVRKKTKIASTKKNYMHYISPDNDILGYKTLEEAKEGLKRTNERRVHRGLLKLEEEYGVAFIKRTLIEEVI